MRIADTEGFDALSMRRLAAELDAGTMTLYHYVRTKDELLTLVVDAVMGEVVLGPDEPMPDRLARRGDADRRADAAPRCCATRGSSTSPTIPPFGPNSVRHFDQSLQAVASLPIPLAERFDIVSVGRRVRLRLLRLGARSGRTRATARATRGRSSTSTAWSRPGTTRSSPRSARSSGSRGPGTQIEEHRRDPDRFARNLRRLLDGIEADLPNLIAASAEG